MGPVIWGSEGSQSELIHQSMDWKDYLLGASHTDRPLHADERHRRVPLGRVRDEQGGQSHPGGHRHHRRRPRRIRPHQANARISELLARNLKLRENVPVADDIEFTGNTAAASIPLAMYELLKSGRAKPGDTALLLGYGAGLSYSGQVVTMPPAPRF